MDDELNQLEAELSELRPVVPSAALLRRIEADLDRPASRPTLAPIVRLWGVAVPAAAAVAMVFTHFSPDTDSALKQGGRIAPSAAALKPIAAENVLVSARDEGLITLDDGTPARRARLQFVDTITWKNPRTNASLTWSVPREEVRIVPVRFQ